MREDVLDPRRPSLGTLTLSFWRERANWPTHLVMAILLGGAFGLVWLSVWSIQLAGELTDVLIGMKWEQIKTVLLWSTIAGLVSGLANVLNYSLIKLVELNWRTWLTEKLQREWLSAHVFYDIEREGVLSNADQRIAEDVKLFTIESLRLFLGFVTVIISLTAYVVVLWQLSGILRFSLGGVDFAIPGYLVFVAIIYNVVLLALTHWIGKRLVGLSMQRQGVEADYRFATIQIRENAEQIAFYGGASVERSRLTELFGKIRFNSLSVIMREAQILGGQSAYTNVLQALPTLAALPRYLAGEITMGGITQVAGAYGSLSAALNWFSQSYQSYANWLAYANRIRDLQWSIEKARQQQNSFTLERTATPMLTTGELAIRDPLHRLLTQVGPLRFAPGERWIIRGPSGTGKSTLLRALGGLWPHGEGNIALPENVSVMFVPQRSYLPTGTFK